MELIIFDKKVNHVTATNEAGREFLESAAKKIGYKDVLPTWRAVYEDQVHVAKSTFIGFRKRMDNWLKGLKQAYIHHQQEVRRNKRIYVEELKNNQQ